MKLLNHLAFLVAFTGGEFASAVEDVVNLSGGDKPGYSCEGANQKKNLGTGFKTPQQCLATAVKDSACGSSIMWSDSYNYSWGCRCCVPGATYTKHNLWDIYEGPSKPGYSCEGANQKKNLGTRFKTPQECLSAALSDSACGPSIMWSNSYNYSWGCRCCVPGATYTKHNLWDIYQTEGNNIAKGKVATQSSTCHGGPAARAVDGNNSGVWGHGSVSHTCKGAMNTWSVTLGLSVITKIVIWNRTDCCAERIKGAKLEILNGDELVASRNIDSTTPNYTFDFEDVVGSVVKVSRANEYLSLAEVEVFGVTKCTLVLHPYMDSGGNDIGRYSGGVNNYKKICLANPRCTCFNSNGWVKYITKPKSQWSKWTNNKSLGLYVKTCDEPISAVCSFKAKYIKKWPHCKNISCTPNGTTKVSMEAMCRSDSDCTGFSFSTGLSTGWGCLKKCGSKEFGGFGATTHDYWAEVC